MEIAEQMKSLCKGLQHVGIPTNDLEKQELFTRALGLSRSTAPAMKPPVRTWPFTGWEI